MFVNTAILPDFSV